MRQGISKYLSSTPIRIKQSDDPPEVKKKVYCDVIDCTTYLAPLAEGEELAKRVGKRAYADVIFSDKNGFEVAKCCYHYDIGLYKARKGRMSAITGEGVDMTMANVQENWDRIDAADREQAASRQRVLENERSRK